ATPAQQWGAWWWRSTSFRYQGRLREALAIAREMRAVEYDSVTSPPRPPYNASLIRGAVLLEMGHAREAAALFDSLATFYARARGCRGHDRAPASGGQPRGARPAELVRAGPPAAPPRARPAPARAGTTGG